MASSASHNMEGVTTALPAAQDPTPPKAARDSPPLDGVDEDDLDVDQDNAQTVMQPAISPLATLLMSPNTAAADKAAVLDHQPNGASAEGSESDGSSDEQHQALPVPQGTTRSAAESVQGRQPGAPRLPTPGQAGPKQFLATEPGRVRPLSISSAFDSRSRHGRSQSVGESALKRLSKALPSISIPSSLIPNISTPTFFSSSSSSATPSHSQTPATLALPGTPVHPDSGRSHTLRSVASEESLLYHTLSRVSSLGDDERFTHVREQVNVRIKAIKDSFDGPSFKLPQMPNILNTLNTPLKKSSTDPLPGTQRSNSVKHSQRATNDPLDAVLETLTGDIVIMGGYRGSILRSAKAPHRQLWVPVKVQLGVRKVNLEVGLDDEDEENMEKHIIADGMLKNIGPVDISRRLFKRLRECENARTGKLRVHDYGYDWRLSPHLLSRKLVEFLERLPSNQPGTPKEQRGALVIAHSLGGLITRHAVNQRPELFSGVLYVGVPQRCINILGPLRNGDPVLLNEKILTAQVNFSLRTTFVFLPEDGFCFVDKVTKEEYRVDFYNVQDWIKYRFCPCVSEPPLPAISRRGTFGSFLNLPDSLSSLPLRSWSSTQSKKAAISAAAAGETSKDRTLAPQLGTTTTTTTSSSSSSSSSTSSHITSSASPTTQTAKTTTTTAAAAAAAAAAAGSPSDPQTRGRNLAYLSRTLAATKQFRSELAHRPDHQDANRYPPLAVMYAKDIPTTRGARVASRGAIACADAYDDLLFASGDGVVLAREAMLPRGYRLVSGGRVCTDRGHITMLGDLAGVGRALGALVRGRRKGIGLGDKAAGQDGGGGGGEIAAGV